MQLGKTIVVLFLVLAMLLGCSREGFKESLNRGSSSQSGSKAESSQSDTSGDSSTFGFNIEEVIEDSVYLNYTLPFSEDKNNKDATKAAQAISEKIQSAIFGFKEQILQDKSAYQLNIFDGISRNDSVYFSIMYEAQFRPEKEAEKANYAFGLVFDPKTGELVGLDAIMAPDALATLLLDEQTSKIDEKNEALAAKKREYLNEQGAKKLAERLTYTNGVVTIERLMDASFYFNSSRLTAVFAAPQEIGGVIEVSLMQ